MGLIFVNIPVLLEISHQQIKIRDTKNMVFCEGIKHFCTECGKQFSNKENITKHKRAEHAGVIYPCKQCGKQFSRRGNFTSHKQAVHEGVKFPCSQCGYQATTKGSLAGHQRAVHEGVKYPCTQCEHHQIQREVLLNIKGQYMKELYTLAVNAVIKQP